MIVDLDGGMYINPRYIIGLKVEKDPVTLKFVVTTVIQNYMGRVCVFTSSNEQDCHDYVHNLTMTKNWS